MRGVGGRKGQRCGGVRAEAVTSFAADVLQVRRGVLRLLAELQPGSLAPLASAIIGMRNKHPEMAHLLRPAAASMIAVNLVEAAE